jgi:curved DNA-binding protein CbpA
VKFVSQSYYEILDVDPSASEERVKRSYRLVRRSFEPESMAIYSLYSPEETEAIGAKIDEAFGILTNRDRRRTYDKFLRYNESSSTVADDPGTFFDQVHDIGELAPLEEFVEDSLDAHGAPGSGGYAVVSAEVQVEDEDAVDIDTADGIELFDPPSPSPGLRQREELSSVEVEVAAMPEESIPSADATLEAVVDGPSEESMELPFQSRHSTVSAQYPVASSSMDSSTDAPSSPRLRAWTREHAVRRRGHADSLKLMPLTEETLTRLRKSAKKGLSGRTLKRIREQRGVELPLISELTKISIMYLRFIEQDCYENLPAPIYLKGFVDQYARVLDLPNEVVDQYMSHYKRVCG